jgi:AbiV family abortive infection protein
LYTNASEECLTNAKQLFDAAKFLLGKGSLGVAQSLCVTALEETAKAIILEFANLNYVGKRVLRLAMRKHPPKKVVIEAFEKGILFVGDLDRRLGKCEVTLGKINELQETLREETRLLEDKRVKGLYVQVRVKDGSVTSSPFSVNPLEVLDFVEKVSNLISSGKSICQFLRDYRENSPEECTRNNLVRFRDDFGNFSIGYDEA